MAANEFDARCTHQGAFSAWLIKNKGEGAKASWFSKTTKRYFTIDFNTQIFFYAHSETQKTVSQPVRFKDIVSADQLPTTSSSKGDSFGFSVLTAERTYELFTDSYQDAELWVFGLNAARDIANGKIPMKHGETANQKPTYAPSEDSTSASSTERHPGGRAPWEPPPPSSMPRFPAMGFAEQSAAEFQREAERQERERAAREAAALREQQTADPFAALDALEELAGPVPELPSAGADQLQAELLREARARVTGGAASKRSKEEIANAVQRAPPAPPPPAYDPVDPYQRPEQPPLAPMAAADAGIVHPAGGIAPPAGGIAPPARGIAPPAGGIAPPAGGIAPPAGGSIAPSVGGIAPPAGGIAPPASMAPPAGSAVGSQPFFQREVAPAAAQAAPSAPAPAPPPPAQTQAAQGEDSDWDEPAPAPPPQMAAHEQGVSSGGWDSDDEQGAPMPPSAAPMPPAQAPMPPSFDTCGAPSRPAQDFVAASKKPQSTGDDLDDLVGEMLGNDSSVIGHGLVDSFHCTGCDFQVMACDEYVWNGDVDYMFFRNNYPTFEKLKKRLVRQAGCRAYCCQCSWKSAHASAKLEDVAEGLRWRRI
eukprot:TRINITY_DN73722_c0_g1_i1.p1 TRINITY_DN73722_c0_g1~~TRINITY_DN73722_c0_g1_i1.p1  ORF type:complete len:594 (+),score=120.86 TRINITY_DN73722_c0_g1_i1:90-1871(+)